MVLTFLLLALAGLAYSDAAGTTCCFPRQYHATQRLTKATVKGSHLSVMTGVLQYWKDSDTHRETFIENLNVDGYNTKVTVIIDQNVTMTKYVIAGNHCTKKSPTTWKDGCVPDFAPLLEESYFGRTTDGLRFQNYDNSVGSVKSYLTVAKDDCFPMFDVDVVPTGSAPYMQAVQLYNFTVGIPDRSIFDIPTICGASLVG